MKMTLPHAVTYVVAALSALASLAPPVQAVIAAVIPGGAVYVPAAIGLAGALVAFIHQIAGTDPATTPAAAPAPTSKQSGHARVWMLVALVALVAGCASIEKFIGTPTGQAVIFASVDVAVATAEQKGISAVKINTIAKAALAADTGVSGTLSAVSALVNAQVAKLNLPAGDQAAADILEAALGAVIQSKLQGNATLASSQAAVADVLNAVIVATGG